MSDPLAPFRVVVDVETEFGPLLSEEVVSRVLLGGCSPDVLAQMRQDREILGVRVGDEYRYPAWQFSGSRRILRGLVDVLWALDFPEVMVLQWLQTPAVGDLTPIDLLIAGCVDRAKSLAQQASEQGAA